MAFVSLKKILPRRLKQAGLERDVAASQVLEITNKMLNELFGDQTTAYQAKALSVKRKHLSIATTDAALRQELKLREKDIIKEINTRMGQSLVEKIRVVV